MVGRWVGGRTHHYVCWFPPVPGTGGHRGEGVGVGGVGGGVEEEGGRVIDYNHRRAGAATDPQSLGTPGRRSTLFLTAGSGAASV